MSRSRSYGNGRAAVHSRRTVLGMVFICSLAIPFRAAAAAPLIKIVAFGDSLTAGYGLPAPDSFPLQLQAVLRARGHAVEIENAGVSGDTSAGGLSRLDWSVQDGTDLVIVALGANDMLRGVDPDATRRSLEGIIQRLQRRGIEVLLCGMRAAPNMGADYVRRFDAIFPALAEKYSLVFYPFFLDGVVAQSRYALQDGLHPNAAGVARIAQSIVPRVEEAIARVNRKRGS